MYTCEYCKKTFNQKYIMNKHQRQAKYCINIRRRMLETELYELDPPQSKTEEILHKKIEQLEQARQQDLKELKELITGITGKSPVVQNMEPITVAHIRAMALEHLDISDLENGLDGIVDFTVKYPLNGRLVCADKSRKKFKYTDENGETIHDYGGTKLSKTVFQGIQNKCVNLIDAKYALLANNIKVAVENNKGYEDYVLDNMQQSTRLQNLKAELIDAAHGMENELQKGYIRKLIKKSSLL